MIESTEELLRARDRLPCGDPRRVVLRARAIELNLALADRLARRYRGRGVPLDDLVQVAALALVTAVDRFDSSRPSSFGAYAVPTIIGSIKRHFRDTTWGLRVPHPTQELVKDIRIAVDDLSQPLRRAPTTAEIAAHLGADLGDVVEAMNARSAYRPLPLSTPAPGAGPTLGDALGRIDGRYASVEDRLALRSLIETLPPQQGRIVELYFYARRTQAAIAAETGISQMHVSRLLKQALGALRSGLAA